MEHKCAHCAKKKERTEKEYKDLINRLNRIEGQVRGVKNMVEKRCLLHGHHHTGISHSCCTKQLQQSPTIQPHQDMRSRQHKRRQR